MAHNSTIPLTQEDFLRLKQNPQPYTRAAIAKKIVLHMESSAPDSSAYQLASDIAFHLQQDKNSQVRQTLAEGIRNSKAVPKDLVLRLANDSVDEIAIPVLRESPILEDFDITKIINETDKQIRLIAVAERKFLSVTISSLLVEKKHESVCAALLNNDTARIEEPTYLRMVALHEKSSVVLQHMMKRVPQPVSAIEKMKKAQMLDAPLQEKQGISSFATLPPQELFSLASAIVMLGANPSEEQCSMLAHRFHKAGRINMMTLLLSVCLGQITLFYLLLSEVTRIPSKEFEINPADTRQLNALLMKAGISSTLFGLMDWVWSGANDRLGQGVLPSSRQMAKLMSIHVREGGRRSINFASTIGIPVANALDKLN